MLDAERVRAIHGLVDLGQVGIAFQPIVDLRRRRIVAYEALAANLNPLFASTPEIFEAAVQAGRVAELGRLHRDQAIRLCPHHPRFLNIDPHEFDYGWLVRPDDPMFRHRHAVTLEITEFCRDKKCRLFHFMVIYRKVWRLWSRQGETLWFNHL